MSTEKSTKNDPYIVEEEKEVLIDEDVLSFLWSAFIMFTCNIPANVLIKINKKDIEDAKNISLFLGKSEDIILASNQGVEKIKQEDIESFSFEELIFKNFVGRWHKIENKKPKDNSYILGSLYKGHPAVVLVHKNKYYIVIPGGTNKEGKDIHVEVTKGLKYWTPLPDHIQAFD